MSEPVSGADVATARERDDERALKLAAVLYMVVFLMKIAVYAVSGVMALFAEALHTLSDLAISVFLLLAAVYSRRAADEHHLFGHARAQYVAALVAATLFISFTSFKLYEEGIPRLFSSERPTYQNLGLVVAVLLISMVVAAVPLVILRRRSHGAAAKAQALELVNDELGLIAALAGTILISVGQPIGDAVAAIAVATVIAVNALGLLRENAGMLLGRSPGADYLARIERDARGVPGVLSVHDVRAEYIGPETLRVGIHVGVAPDITMAEADEIRRRVGECVAAGPVSHDLVIQVESVEEHAHI